ncbi:hypothetical protein GH714_031459 [Hevea brasiliensis]|uniref:Uncharacterized protein n=1 Tax=Hevea brasiliensis TaxID=3981 RepID=A0A6A6LLY1_HEVBR|nr:hypothetical protein GH714_031459 [Hevea brasiliensis]
MCSCLITYTASLIKRHDDVSSWVTIMQEKWSSEEVVLPDSKELKDKLHEKLDKEEQDKQNDVQEAADEGLTIDDGEQSISQNQE